MWWLFSLLLLTGVESYSASARPSSGSSTPPKIQERRASINNGVKYLWSSVDFLYSNPARKEDDILSGNLQPDSVVVLDADAIIGFNGVRREFVTTPSLFPGTPFTLAEVTNKNGEGGPILKPFPNEQWHYRGDCNSIISPFRIKIDKKGRMWVMDTGKINVFTAPQKVCDPQILAFDLNHNNTLIKRYRIPAEQIEPRTLFVNLEVEVQGDDTWVYMADPVSFKMLVYSMKKDASHSVTHPYFFPDPLYGYYVLNGVNFTLMDGLLSLALAGENRPGHAKMYFHSLSAGREGLVQTSILKNEAELPRMVNEFKMSVKDRESHASVEVVTKNGIMIFANLEDNALYSWDTKTTYSPKNFKLLVKSKENLQFVSGMKLVGDELYVLSSRLQNAIAGALAKGAPNYRLLVFKTDKLLSRQLATIDS